jgi:hypothetical protein
VVIKGLFNKHLCQFADIAEANPSIMKWAWCRNEVHFYVNGTVNKQKNIQYGKQKIRNCTKMVHPFYEIDSYCAFSVTTTRIAGQELLEHCVKFELGAVVEEKLFRFL